MMKHALTPADLAAQTALELPDRELMALVRVGNIRVTDVYVLNNFLNHWDVDVDVEVGDVLSDNEVDVELAEGAAKRG